MRSHLVGLASVVGLVISIQLGTADQGKAARPLELGFFDNLFESSDANVRDRWLGQAAADGGRYALSPVIWRDVAPATKGGLDADDPADPAYDWEAVDRFVQSADLADLQPILTVTRAPSWAEGEGRPNSAPAGTWKPDPSALKQFAEALASRYSGRFMAGGSALPRVSNYQAWTEPNLSNHLTPVFSGRRPVAAVWYRDLLNAFYAGVKAVSPKNRVITAGTGPYGDSPGDSSSRIRPLAFWREVMCLKNRDLDPGTCPSKAAFDVLSHHPINTSGPPGQSALNPDDVSSPDMGSLRKTLQAAERAGTVKGAANHPLWATELWWASDPPDSSQGVKPALQARYIAQHLYLLWKDRVEVAINLRIRDGDTNVGEYGTGLYYLNGKPKPSARAFRFPFVAQAKEGRSVELWGKAPTSGRVAIERKTKRGWRRVAAARAGKTRIFTSKVRLSGRLSLRARAGGEKSLVWKLK